MREKRGGGKEETRRKGKGICKFEHYLPLGWPTYSLSRVQNPNSQPAYLTCSPQSWTLGKVLTESRVPFPPFGT